MAASRVRGRQLLGSLYSYIPIYRKTSCFCYAPISSYASAHVTPPLCYHNTGRTCSLSLPRPTWQAAGARTHTPHAVLWACQLHTTPPHWEEVAKVKSVVEKAVDTIREKKKGKVPSPDKAVATPPKPSLWVRIKDTTLHTITGFKLFWLDAKISWRLLRKTMRGETLTRREQKQFRRTVGDIFRLVPFSVFVIVPFMELLLPVYLYFFPNMLPSTFQSSSSKDARKKSELRVKLQMAQFLQDTIEEMALKSSSKSKGDAVREFAEFFEQIRSSGEQASTKDIVSFSKLFEDQLTLDNLTRPQLVALCKLLLLKPLGTNNFLRFQLRLKLRQLEADDRLIMQEGVDSLTDAELQSACQARGMRALGLPPQRLKAQLQQWLDLHLTQQVPTSLLLLSRALYMTENVPDEAALKATISALPENIVDEAGLQVAAASGEDIDNRARTKVLMHQEQLIREEHEEVSVVEEEREKARKKEESRAAEEVLQDKFAAEPDDTIPRAVLKDLSKAVESLKKDTLQEDLECLKELIEEKKEYDEDVEDLQREVVGVEGEGLQVSGPAAALSKRVESLISQVDHTLHALGAQYLAGSEQVTVPMGDKRGDVTVATSDLCQALTALEGTTQESKIHRILSVLDEDHDGVISLEELTEVIELLGREDTDIDEQTLKQLTQLLKREDFWEEHCKQRP